MTDRLPDLVSDDPRIGSEATSADGFTGTVETVYRFEDGYEVLIITDGTFTTEAASCYASTLGSGVLDA